jgi:ceramide glucosyltransferase
MDISQAATLATAVTLTAAHCGSAAIAGWRQRVQPELPRHRAQPRVSVVRPLKGIDALTETCLASTFKLTWDNLEIVFCVANDDDPVVPLVKRLLEVFPDAKATLLVGHCRISGNPKLNNMAKAWDAVDGDWIVFVDANVHLPADAVQRLLAMDGPRIGLVSSPPRAVAPDGCEANVECSMLNSYQGRWQSAADAMGYGFAQGKVLAFKRNVLEHSMGLALLGREPAEDAAATKLVRTLGQRVRVVERFFEQPVGRRSWHEIWQRQARWACLRRASFPWQYAAEALSFPWLATALAAMSFDAVPSAAMAAGAVLVVWYGAEAICSAVAGWPEKTQHRILRDLIMPVAWIHGWLYTNFEWHGHKMSAGRSPSIPAG